MTDQKHYKKIIFDFDGTLVDSYALILDVLDDSEMNRSLNLSRSQLEHLKGLSMREIVKELHIPLTKLPFFVHSLRNEMRKHLDRLRLFDGIEQSLEAIKARNLNIWVVSSNSRENIVEFFKLKNMNVFNDVISDDSVFFKHRAINSLIKDNKLDKVETVYIGDEVRDIHAAQKAGLDIISGSWGFNHKEKLQEHNPTFIADYPSQILEIIS